MTSKHPLVGTKGEIEFDCVKIMNIGRFKADGVAVVFYAKGKEVLRLPQKGTRLSGEPCLEITNLRAYLPYVIQ